MCACMQGSLTRRGRDHIVVGLTTELPMQSVPNCLSPLTL